jgi:hypothetical protein
VGVYDEDIETARELIAEFGQQCYWQKPAPTVAAEPGYPTTGELPQPLPCKIAFFRPKDLDSGVTQFADMIAGTEVSDNTEIGLMEGGVNFTPENPDRIRRGAVDAEPISIIKIDRLAPNGTPVLYFVTVAA